MNKFLPKKIIDILFFCLKLGGDIDILLTQDNSYSTILKKKLSFESNRNINRNYFI